MARKKVGEVERLSLYRLSHIKTVQMQTLTSQ